MLVAEAEISSPSLFKRSKRVRGRLTVKIEVGIESRLADSGGENSESVSIAEAAQCDGEGNCHVVRGKVGHSYGQKMLAFERTS